MPVGVDYSSCSFESSPEQSLLLLRTRFPVAMEKSVLALRCTAKFSLGWEQDTCQPEALVSMLEFANACDHTGLRMLTFHSIWVRTLKPRYLSLVSLIEKVGKAPKERLLLKDIAKGGVAMDNASTHAFAFVAQETMRQLVSVAANGSAGAGSVNGVPADTDERWTEHSNQGAEFSFLGDGCITDAATAAQPLNTFVVQQHAVLSCVVWAIVGFQLRSVRPLSLFSGRVRGMFFAPFEEDHPDLRERSASLASESVAIDQVHEDPEAATAAAALAELQSARRQFLCRALVAAVHHDTTAADSITTLPLPTVAEIFALADTLDLKQDDVLARQYVRNLYETARDGEAQAAIVRVADTAALAAALLEVAGHRLALLMDKRLSENALDVIARIPGDIYEWCTAVQASQPLPGQGGCKKVGPAAIRTLVQSTLALVSSDTATSQRLQQIVSALETFT